MNAPVPGAFFLTTIAGAPGFAVGVGQALTGYPSRWSHAGIVLNEEGDVVEADPEGARCSNLSAYTDRPLRVCDGPVQTVLADMATRELPSAGFEAAVRADVVRQALRLVSTPYSWLDYFALALLHLHLPSSWVRKRVERRGRLICSQLVDLVYRRAGIHLWTDGRLAGDVMPSDLAAWADDWAHMRAVMAR